MADPREILSALRAALTRHEAATDAITATAAGDDPHAAALAGIELDKASALLATWTQPEYLRALIDCASIPAPAEGGAVPYARFAELLRQEHALSDAYVRLRQIIGAMDPPTVTDAEALWAYVESVAREKLAGQPQPKGLTSVCHIECDGCLDAGKCAFPGKPAEPVRYPHPDEDDAVTLWAEIHRLRAAVQGPDGYATWQEAATAERVRRVAAEKALAAAQAPAPAPEACPDEKWEADVECITDESGTDYSVSIRGPGLRNPDYSDVWMKKRPAEQLAKWLNKSVLARFNVQGAAVGHAPDESDLDAWQCDRCHGKGWHWVEREGVEWRDKVSSKEHCEQCDGLGWLGPDAAKAAEAELNPEGKAQRRLEWLHSPGSNNVDGWEWGIYRVKYDEAGKVASMQHTFSDFSDLDAAMAASKPPVQGTQS